MEMTREQFFVWIITQPKLNTLFEAWKESGFDKNLRPSVDRLDDYKPYSLSNIRLTTWEENNRKGNEDRKSGVNSKVNHKIIINGIEYPSKSEAVRQEVITFHAIKRILAGDTAKGFENYTVEMA